MTVIVIVAMIVMFLVGRRGFAGCVGAYVDDTALADHRRALAACRACAGDHPMVTAIPGSAATSTALFTRKRCPSPLGS